MTSTTDPEASGKPQSRPVARGFKRNILLISGLLVMAIFTAVGLVWWVQAGSNKGGAPASAIGPINPAGNGEVRRELSPAMQEKQDRVFREEAAAAQKSGRTYIPNEGTLGPSEPVESLQQSTAAEVGRPIVQRMAGNSNAQHAQDNQGLMRQVERIMAGMEVKAAPVQAFQKEDADIRKGAAPVAVASANSQDQGANATPSRGADLTQGQEIHAGELLSPIDTDKTDEVMAKVTGGPLAGATFVGKVVVFEEDFSIGFTSMRFNGKYYSVQAVGVNEQTASRAMGADVDHRFWDRYVMPVLSSGLWGAATYFTERGRTAQRYVPTGIGGDIVVSDERASKEDAKNTGIGAGISKAQQITEAEVQRRANKKNRMTLPQYTPIGIRFDQPVYAKDAK